MTANQSADKRLMIVGEVLFDCFSDHRVLGGAPFNVAWNLRGFGHDPLVISAVGDDDLGREVLSLMDQWQLDTRAIQIQTDKPTARVDVTLIGGEPSYTFWEDVAFDHLQPSELATAPVHLFYHGSLAMRSPQSAESIRKMRHLAACPVFVDVNVRPPYFDPQWIESHATGIDHLKLNLDEFQLFLRTLDLPTWNAAAKAGEAALAAGDADDGVDWQPIAAAAERLKQRLQVGSLWLTAGEYGAACLPADGDFAWCPAASLARVRDTVGAGDAFSAVVLHGLLAAWSPDKILANATAFAAKVCGLSGATTTDQRFYRLPDAPTT